MFSDEGQLGACPSPVHGRLQAPPGRPAGRALQREPFERTFRPACANPELARGDDGARLEVEGARLAFATGSFVVSPLFFPGGDMGRLAVNGTVNELAAAGAEPLRLAAAIILEEGLPLEDLERVILSMRSAAAEAGVAIVTGETKVVGRGAADGMFVTTTGIGRIPPGHAVASERARPGDVVIVSGTLGDHGIAVLSARQELGLRSAFASDTAPLHELVAALLNAAPDTHAMRAPTRGGLAGALHEIAEAAGVAIELAEARIPVRAAVRSACGFLGLDPLYVANQGKLVAFVPEPQAERALRALRAHPLGRGAAAVGRVAGEGADVGLRTAAGGTRLLVRPYGEFPSRLS